MSYAENDQLSRSITMEPTHHEPVSLSDAVTTLGAFLGNRSLTEKTAALEESLNGQLGADVGAIAHRAGIDAGLLSAALLVRAELGRVSDLIHAAAITLSLPHILKPDERVSNRPSLAAGNDPSRPFDIETDQRIAEFKLAQWTGADAMRKRQVFKDLFKLAIDDSDRVAELYVVGARPLKFLRESKSTARWALDRNTAVARQFTEKFGTLEIPIRDYTAKHAAHVRLIDLTATIPELFAHLD